ncbi:MAG: phosphodiester glycosidase family protein [Clostridia bacterium]|nr:phosphodiester glycosidase family protein [Clostridia bacterium]
MKKRKFSFGLCWGILCGVLLIAYTIFVLLDTFVIPSVYIMVPQETPRITPTLSTWSTFYPEETLAPSLETAEPQISQTPVVTDKPDTNPVSIQLHEYRYCDTTVYVADVKLSSPDYLRTAFAMNAYGRNITQKTSVIASNHQAVLAINGDFYGSRERGYVIRDGVLYRDTRNSNNEDLVIYKDGSFGIVREDQVSAQTLIHQNAMHVFSFGPALVIDGKISVDENDEVGKAMVNNPRTAIAIVDELHYLFIVSDGRTSISEGLTLYELAEFVKGLGAQIAYNLDGGGSSTMVYNGKVINNPTTNGKTIQERAVSDIVYIG